MIPNDDDIRFLAQLIDERGRLTIRRHTVRGNPTPEYRCVITLYLDTHDAAEMHAMFGGSLYRNPEWTTDRVRWQATTRHAATLLRQVLPMLHSQQPQAQCLIALDDLRQDTRSYRTKVVGTHYIPTVNRNGRTGEMHMQPTLGQSDGYIHRCDELRRRIIALNAAQEER